MTTAYPFVEPDGTQVLGPQVIAASDGSVINWKGVNYVPQAAVAEATARERQRTIEMADHAGAFYITYELPEFTSSQPRPILHRFADLLDGAS